MRLFKTRLRALSMPLVLAIVLFSALVAAPAANGQTYKVLYNFTGGSDGGWPYFGSLVQDKAGNLYGTTVGGGSSGYGTVFKVTKSGKESVLYSFTGGADGGYPSAGLVLSGNTLYGTTTDGGASGDGVVFEVNTKTGTETVLYTFTGGADGAFPYAGLVQDKSGNLYGTTYEGGSRACYQGDGGCGVVFQVVPKTKKEIVLHSFDYSDGANPSSGLTLDPTEKALFGTATFGGSSNCRGGCGVVFSLTIKSGTYNVLYNFTGSPDGAHPEGTLALGPTGNLYGTTVNGGNDIDAGTVFEVVPKTKKETVLYIFPGGADGGGPNGVIRDKKGKLYGTTAGGGTTDAGTVFEVVPNTKTETVLHSFGGSDGWGPLCGLLQDSKGNLYGTTYAGGSGTGCDSYGCGVVWEITP
jgi:uncharacterized repeat protein (TIGR03803 family)